MTDMLVNVGNELVDEVIAEVAADVLNTLANSNQPERDVSPDPIQAPILDPVASSPPNLIAAEMQDSASGMLAQKDRQNHTYARVFSLSPCQNKRNENNNENVVAYVNSVKDSY